VNSYQTDFTNEIGTVYYKFYNIKKSSTANKFYKFPETFTTTKTQQKEFN